MTWNSNNYKQKATGHITFLLANGHLTGSDTLFACKIPTASNDKNKRDNFAMGTPADFDPTKACKQHKSDTFTKLGEPTIRAACTPQTVLDQHFWCFFYYIHPSSSQITVSPTKACLLCATPAGTSKVQYPGFPKIVYCLQAESTKTCVKQNVMTQ